MTAETAPPLSTPITPTTDTPAATATTPAEPTYVPIDRTAEQYPIYAAILASGAPNYNLGNQLVILDQTQSIDLARIPVDLSALPPALVADYLAANDTPQPLDANFDLTLPYTFINEPDRQQYVNDWPAFSAAYPDAEGYLTFSAAGFSPDGNQALVYMSFLCGPLCGAGDLYLLTKESGSWQVQKTIGLWMS